MTKNTFLSCDWERGCLPCSWGHTSSGLCRQCSVRTSWEKVRTLGELTPRTCWFLGEKNLTVAWRCGPLPWNRADRWPQGRGPPRSQIGNPTPIEIIRPEKPVPPRETVGGSRLWMLRSWARRAEHDWFWLRTPEAALNDADHGAFGGVSRKGFASHGD